MMHKRKTTGLLAIALLLLMALLPLTMPQAIGMSLAWPNPWVTPTPEATWSIDAILSDGQFVYGPNIGDFDVAVYLKAKPGRLIEYADVFQQWAPWFSINPKVLLTILEVQNRLVTDPVPVQRALNHPVGYSQTGFAFQIERLSGTLFNHFYSRLYD